MDVLSFAFAFAGCASVALTLDRHWRLWLEARPQTALATTILRTVACVALAASLMVCLASEPVGIAILVWSVEAMAGAALTATVYALRDRHKRAHKQRRRMRSRIRRSRFDGRRPIASGGIERAE